MKKFVSLLICSILLLASVPTAFATTEEKNLDTYLHSEIIEMYPQVAQKIKSGIEAYSTSINLAQYSLSIDEAFAIYQAVAYENAELFYIIPTSISYSSFINGVYSIKPYYIIEKENLEQERVKFNNAVNYFLDGVDESWSDFDKCIYVHDKLVSECEYDRDASTVENNTIRTAYGALVNNEAVCQGYSLAYNYLLECLGIKAHYIISVSANHGWSMVELDGNYYHVDLTFADPLYDVVGRVDHEYCMISDSKILELRPNGTWTINLHATDTTYDEQWWKDVDSAIYNIDGKYYYIDRAENGNGYGALKCYDKATDTHTTIYDIASNWYANADKTAVWNNCYSRLVYDGELLYFNTSDKVYTIKPDGSELTVYYEKPESQKLDIYGLSFQTDGRLYVDFRSQINKLGVNVVIDGSTGEFEKGDVNYDKKLSIRDATIIQMYLVKMISIDTKTNALSDYNCDGSISISDVTAIQKYLCKF